MKKLFTLLSIVMFLFSSCSNDEKAPPVISCGSIAALTNEETFNAIETGNYTITNVTLNGDCLSVTIGASGCNPENWDMNLYATDAFFEVFPLQRFAKIELVNIELCAAAFQKTKIFDLTPYQLQGQNTLPIHLDGWDEQINYQY